MNNVLDSAIAQMEEAIRLYRSRQFEQAIETRILAEELFATHDSQINLDLENDKTLYGDNINLGIINHIVNQNIKDLTDAGNIKPQDISFINTYANSLKGNDNCKAQYNIYNKLSTYSGENLNDFVEIVLSSYMPNVKFSNSAVDNRTILPQLRNDTTFNEYVQVDDLDIDLYSTIESLIETYNSPEHFQTYSEAKKTLAELLRKKYSQETIQGDTLTLSELDFLDNVRSMNIEEQEEEFNKLKEQVKEVIKNKLVTAEMEELHEWLEIYKKIENKTYTQDNAIADLSEFTELLATLN